ncbi:helix-turn-helix domain-containing protein [Nitrospinae bacterium AH_259_B05_G02_I21]|nr:helix-turn-helix domain-containing protein [Nitrospinae bacterium AH_259_B05_G02_I21]MDA2932141.1 helix-turn-helix domain-containing protein [Nitrospinae bacterium AH-259-F20]
MDKLKAIRLSRGLSQWAVAKLVGKSQATVQVWEAGYREPSAEDMEALAHALGVELMDLADTA